MYHILHHEKPLELTKKDCCPLYKAKWSRSGVDLVHQSTKRKHPWQPATSKKSPSQISLYLAKGTASPLLYEYVHITPGDGAKPHTLNAPRRHTGTTDRAPTAIATREWEPQWDAKIFPGVMHVHAGVHTNTSMTCGTRVAKLCMIQLKWKQLVDA